MIGFAAALAVFCAAALVVLRLVARQAGGDATRSAAVPAVAVWLLYFLHADTVAAAAYADVGRVSLPGAPFLAVGLTVAAAGWALFLAATFTLAGRGRFAGLRPTALVTAGPYRFSRHPQNTGWALLLLGVAVASRSVIALVLVGVFAVFSARLTRIEEDELERRHGGDYRAYRDATPLLLGPPARRVAA